MLGEDWQSPNRALDLQLALRLHRLRWSREGGSYGIPPGAGEAFHREVVPLLAERGRQRT